MKLWRIASVLFGLVVAVQAWGAQAAKRTSKPSNELTVAGLRPGVNKLADAEKRFGDKHRQVEPAEDGLLLWADPCTGRTLRVEVDDAGVIQSVTVSSLGPANPDCAKAPAKKPAKATREPLLATGLGLALGQARQRVVQLYGEPHSELPATYEGRDFELLFYAFDWAGTEVPQVMEITCERGSGRVRKITLAYPSL